MNKYKIIIKTTVRIVLLLTLLVISIPSFTKSLDKTIAKDISSYLKNSNVSANYYVATNKNKVITQGASGYFDCNKKYSMKLNNKMPIASITKSMTAASILLLHEQNKIELHDYIYKYIPNNYWPDNKLADWAYKITIHHLLTHSSGIPNYTLQLSLRPEMTDEEIKKEMLKYASTQPLLSKPGDKYHYSNTGYFILGMIIENVTKKELKDFFAENLFKPLGMNNTFLPSFKEGFKYQLLGDKKLPERCFVYLNNNNNVEKVDLVPVKSDKILPAFADGGVISTVKDLHKWSLALHNVKIINQDSYNKMIYPHIHVEDTKTKNRYAGYGIHVDTLESGEKIYGHSGNANVIRGELWYLPSKMTNIAILGNMTIKNQQQQNIDYSNLKNHFDILFLRNHIIDTLLAIKSKNLTASKKNPN